MTIGLSEPLFDTHQRSEVLERDSLTCTETHRSYKVAHVIVRNVIDGTGIVNNVIYCLQRTQISIIATDIVVMCTVVIGDDDTIHRDFVEHARDLKMYHTHTRTRTWTYIYIYIYIYICS